MRKTSNLVYIIVFRDGEYGRDTIKATILDIFYTEAVAEKAYEKELTRLAMEGSIWYTDREYLQLFSLPIKSYDKFNMDDFIDAPLSTSCWDAIDTPYIGVADLKNYSLGRYQKKFRPFKKRD